MHQASFAQALRIQDGHQLADLQTLIILDHMSATQPTEAHDGGTHVIAVHFHAVFLQHLEELIMAVTVVVVV